MKQKLNWGSAFTAFAQGIIAAIAALFVASCSLNVYPTLPTSVIAAADSILSQVAADANMAE